MAVSSSTTFNTSNPGVPAAVPTMDIYSVSTAPQFPVGFKVERGDGNTYRYAHLGAATGPGLVVSQDLSESSVVDSDNLVVAGSAVIGTKELKFVLASTTLNQFAGAYLSITDDTGEGYQYRIAGNTAAATVDGTANVVIMTLLDPLKVALDATSDIAITANRYANLEAATPGTDFDVVGVTCADFTAGSYGWLVTKGRATILTEGTTVLGAPVGLSASAAGAVAPLVAAGATIATVILAVNKLRIGRCIAAGDNTGYSSFDINLD